MEVTKTIDKLKEKYSLDFDTFYYNKEKQLVYCNLASDIIKEVLFLNTLISRTKQGIATFTALPKLPLQFWDLFEKEIAYYSASKYYENDLTDRLIICSFMSKFFYVDMSWKKEDAELLEKLVEDEEATKMVKYFTGFETKTLLRETSYYYNDDVWAITKKYFTC